MAPVQHSHCAPRGTTFGLLEWLTSTSLERTCLPTSPVSGGFPNLHHALALPVHLLQLEGGILTHNMEHAHNVGAAQQTDCPEQVMTGAKGKAELLLHGTSRYH